MTARMPNLSCASVQTASEQTFSVRMISRSGFFAPPRLAELNDSLDVYPKCRTLRDVWLNKYPLRAMASSTTVRGSAFSFGGSHRPKERRTLYRNDLDVSSQGIRPGIRWDHALCLGILAALAGREEERRATNPECESEAGNRGQLSDFLDSRARIVQPGRSREAPSLWSHRAQVG